MKCECGKPIYDGMVWHGKKWDAKEWVMTYGVICVFCQAEKERIERAARADRPKRKGGKRR